MTDTVYIDEKGNLLCVTVKADGKNVIIGFDAGRCIRSFVIKESPEVKKLKEVMELIERRYNVGVKK